MSGKPILAIDPGPEQSAWLRLEDGVPKVEEWLKGTADAAPFGIWENPGLGRSLSGIRHTAWGDPRAFRLVIESIESYGMAVGRSTFETCYWIGRFDSNCRATLLPRLEVKLHLCGSARAKDSNIRQALIDRFGGKEKAIGKKATPGPLYGVKSHIWSALALAVTFYDQNSGGDAK